MVEIIQSIQPLWCEFITLGKKRWEIRKSRPKYKTPFKVYIYATKGKGTVRLVNFGYGRLDYYHCDKSMRAYAEKFPDKFYDGKIIGEYICDRIEDFYLPYPAYFSEVPQDVKQIITDACLTLTKAHHYIGTSTGYAWHISDLKVYDKPKSLTDFIKPCNKNANCAYCKKALLLGGNCNGRFERPPQSWCFTEGVNVSG